MSKEPSGGKALWFLAAGVVVVILAAAAGSALRAKKAQTGAKTAQESGLEDGALAEPNRPLVFSKDIAPIVFKSCSGCHHPGQAAPFPLLTYEHVKKHARQIVDATGRRYMPPWLPEPGYGEFAGNRSLTEAQIARIRRWVDEGAAQGNDADLPPAPEYPNGWRLGQPDFVMTLPQAYNLPADGKDIYRNLVAPIPTTAPHFVRAVEFLPGNYKAMHHAFIEIDETRKSRRLAERQNPPGFDGMELPDTAKMPLGQLMGWQPGKLSEFSPPGLSWYLRTNTDLVLQMHMHPTGKPETVQPSLGFYFTDQPPTNSAFCLGFKYFKLDIPPGASDYAVDSSYTLPVDLTVLAVSTHAHYLAKEMQGFAILPGGEKKWLIWIKNWDFNWQGDYPYASPQFLPKGSQICFHYTYDNSTNNVRNPNPTPKRVRFGLQSDDEMAEFWLQALARNTQDQAILAKDYFENLGRLTMDYDRFRIANDPNDVDALSRLGHDLHMLGRLDEAMTLLSTAARVKPDSPKGHYGLALLYLSTGKMDMAEQELLATVRLDPYSFEARGNLGRLYMQTQRPAEARAAFTSALQVNPDDAMARKCLDQLSRQ